MVAVYRNAGKPEPPMVELRDLPNGTAFNTVDGLTQTKIGWHKDSELTGAIKVCDSAGVIGYMCASAHVTPAHASGLK